MTISDSPHANWISLTEVGSPYYVELDTTTNRKRWSKRHINPDYQDAWTYGEPPDWRTKPKIEVKGQTRWESVKETVHQMWFGFVLSVIANYLFVKIFGIVDTFIMTVALTVWMTIFSAGRSYFIRRIHAR